ncbi:MAG: hypothetical protein KGL58_09115 [Pseudomonadota bacterium]|nr:hypothetical protein [Pseudomonadota bacterium]
MRARIVCTGQVKRCGGPVESAGDMGFHAVGSEDDRPVQEKMEDDGRPVLVDAMIDR